MLFAVGSSPHTRGARGPDHDRDRPVGIIPAYAGSTRLARGRRSEPWDHPRIRGEHCVRESVPRTDQGSSPHTRGALGCPSLSPSDSRIIPAYAGSTILAPLMATCRRDHPRIRGEHRRGRYWPSTVSGSSPHTRGARHRLGCAGDFGRDHPRIRGEHSCSSAGVK